ncbi:hypothetical protein PG985_007789 [Apiospora marii]|uniref:uncharacterized protein n=1 Tax=Apiospora marii TaxID=335849 RepID=UPI00312E9935
MNRATAFFFLANTPQLIASRVIRVRQTVVVQCDFETNVTNGDSCSSFAAVWGLTPNAFASINPGVSCPGDLVAGQNYCVVGTATSGPAGTTTTTARAPINTTAKPIIRTTSDLSTTTAPSSPHEPTQSGLAANCNNLHLVTVASPTITPTAPTAPAASSHSPQMPDIMGRCDKFYQVQFGDSGWSIEQDAGISSAQFLAWNPAVDAACDNMWLGYYRLNMWCVFIDDNVTATGHSSYTPSRFGTPGQIVQNP